MKKYLLIAAILCVPIAAFGWGIGLIGSGGGGAAPASIEFDAAGTVRQLSDTSATISNFVMGSGSNGVIILFIAYYDTTGDVHGTTLPYFNTDEEFTKLNEGNSASNQYLEVWYLVNPTNTTADIVVTFDESISEIALGATSWFNVDQTTPLDGFATATDSNTVVSVTVSSAVGDLVHDALLYYGNGEPTETAPQVERFKSHADDLNTKCIGSTDAGAASVNNEWTQDNSRVNVRVGVNINVSP